MSHNTNHTARDNPYRPAPGSDPPALVGRDPELAVISYLAKLAEHGSAPQPVILVGLRGIGKNRFAPPSDPLDRRAGRHLQQLARETAGYPFFIQEFGSAAWATRESNEITEELAKSIIPAVRRLQDSALYEPMFDTLTAPEMNYAFAMATLGQGKQHVSRVAAAIGHTVQSANWIRNQLIAKDVIYAPAKGLVEFRLPLTENYIERHRSELLQRVGLPL